MLARVGLACAALAAVCWASQHWLLADWTGQGFGRRLGSLLLAVAAGAVAFVVSGVALRIEELEELVTAIRRRLQR